MGNLEGAFLGTQHFAHLAAPFNVADREDQIIGIYHLDRGNRNFARKPAAIFRVPVGINHHMAVFVYRTADTLDNDRRKARNTARNRHIDNLFLQIAEILLRPRVDFNNMPVLIGNDNRIIHPGQILPE